MVLVALRACVVHLPSMGWRVTELAGPIGFDCGFMVYVDACCRLPSRQAGRLKLFAWSFLLPHPCRFRQASGSCSSATRAPTTHPVHFMIATRESCSAFPAHKALYAAIFGVASSNAR